MNIYISYYDFAGLNDFLHNKKIYNIKSIYDNNDIIYLKEIFNIMENKPYKFIRNYLQYNNLFIKILFNKTTILNKEDLTIIIYLNKIIKLKYFFVKKNDIIRIMNKYLIVDAISFKRYYKRSNSKYINKMIQKYNDIYNYIYLNKQSILQNIILENVC